MFNNENCYASELPFAITVKKNVSWKFRPQLVITINSLLRGCSLKFC